MEPDALPIRAGWLPRLLEEASAAPCRDFWIKGSMPRCDSTYGAIKQRMDMHINGNAFLCLGDPGFDTFLARVRAFYPGYQAPESSVPGCSTGQGFEGG